MSEFKSMFVGDANVSELNLEIARFSRLIEGWANFSYDRPRLKKVLQPRAAHFHYKVGKFTLCVNEHTFILNKAFVFRININCTNPPLRIRTPALNAYN